MKRKFFGNLTQGCHVSSCIIKKNKEVIKMSEQYCQSCGMPLTSPEFLGTEKDGTKSVEYCLYCYENGAYKQPDTTMEQMIEICVPYMKQHGMSEAQARELMNNVLPKLKRWRRAV
jgi:hypothetical protein